MTDVPQSLPSGDAPETVLRAELAHGDAMIGTVIPILRHLLASDDHSVFSEEIVARTRAMIVDVARQLLVARAEAADEANPHDIAADALAVLVDSLSSDSLLLAHVHALALEWQLTQKLESRLSLDPVVSPIVQTFIASPDPQVADTGMRLLASQARFAQSLRRMNLALLELPADALHSALLSLRSQFGEADDAARQAQETLCDSYDEARTRLGLMLRLVLGMGGGAHAALSVTQAGVALFLTTLSITTGQDRALATLATNEGQGARLALALSASGMKAGMAEQQFAALHPDVPLPAGFDELDADRAAAILAQGAGYPV